jgi:hypothetical protein
MTPLFERGGTIPVALVVGLALALLSVTPSGVSASHAGQCGPTADGEFYACGEIVVDLKPDADATIEEVVARQGGNPETDILPLPPQVPENRYAVAVEVGGEADAVAAYQQDPAVAAAMLNILQGAAGGASPTPQPLPDSAVADNAGAPGMPAVVLAALLLATLAILAAIRVRRVWI